MVTECIITATETPSYGVSVIENPSHHHGEGGKVGVTLIIAVPVVTVETSLMPVQLEPVAVRVAKCGI